MERRTERIKSLEQFPAPLAGSGTFQGRIAGHLLLFSTWSRGFFFQRPFPQWKLFWAIMGTQVFAALMAGNGWLVT